MFTIMKYGPQGHKVDMTEEISPQGSHLREKKFDHKALIKIGPARTERRVAQMVRIIVVQPVYRFKSYTARMFIFT